MRSLLLVATLVLFISLFQVQASSQLLSARTGGASYAVAPICCVNCQYQSDCCCAPRDVLPIKVRRTQNVLKKRTRIIVVTKAVAVTQTAVAKAGLRRNLLLRREEEASEDEADENSVQLESPLLEQAETAEDTQDSFEGEISQFEKRFKRSGGAAHRVETLANDDEELEPIDEQEITASSSDHLFKRHLCPRCPASSGIGPRGPSSGRNNGGSSGATFCCPERKRITLTSKKTVTQWIRRTRTRTKTATRTQTVTNGPLSNKHFLSGTLFNDANGNGVQDSGEAKLPGVAVSLYSTTAAAKKRALGSVLARNVTDGVGYFEFTFYAPAAEQVVVIADSHPDHVLYQAAASASDNTPVNLVLGIDSSWFTTTKAPAVGTSTSAPKKTTSAAAAPGQTTANVIKSTTKPVSTTPQKSTTPVTTSSRTTITQSTTTSQTSSTSITLTSSTSETQTTSTTYTASTETPHPPSAPPVVRNVSSDDIGVISWTTNVTGSGDSGYPPAYYFLRCNADGDPCNGTAVAETTPVPYTGIQTLYGLAMNSNFSCYVVATNSEGTICSDPVPVKVPPGQRFTIYHPNGSEWLNDGGNMRLGTGTPIPWTAFAKKDESIGWDTGYIQFYSSENNGWLSTGSWYAHLNPGGTADAAFQLWHHPDGGTAFYSSQAPTFIGYSEARDQITMGTNNADEVLVLNWNITPKVPEAYYTDTFVWPDVPRAPMVALDYEIRPSGNVDLTGQNTGHPAAAYMIRCVPFGGPCSSTWRTESSLGGTITGLTVPGNYSCFSLAVHPLGTLCSVNSTDLVVPEQAGPFYNISVSAGGVNPWRWDFSNNVIWTNAGSGQQMQVALQNHPSYGGWALMSSRTNDTSGIFFDTGSWWLHLQSSVGVGFQFWRSGDGTYAIQSSDGSRFLGINSNKVMMMADPSQAKLDWYITPDPPDAYIGGNLTYPSVPNAPTNGTIDVNMWTTNIYFIPTAASPEELYAVKCFAAGTPCTGTSVADTGFLSRGSVNANPSYTLGGFLPNGTSYDCYTIVKNIRGSICSNVTTITTNVPANVTFFKISLNSTDLMYRTASNQYTIVANAGNQNVSFGMYRFASDAAGWSHMIHNIVSGNVWLSNGGWMWHPQGTKGNYLYRFWRNPSGGFGIQTNDQGNAFLGYDGTWVRMVPNTDPSVLYWGITPEPEEQYIAGNLTLPDPPSAPTGLTVWGINSLAGSWTKGASTGFPTATFFFRCVDVGQDCSNSTRWESNQVAASATQSANAGGFVVNKSYDCYAVGHNAVGETCSTTSTSVFFPNA